MPCHVHQNAKCEGPLHLRGGPLNPDRTSRPAKPRRAAHRRHAQFHGETQRHRQVTVTDPRVTWATAILAVCQRRDGPGDSCQGRRHEVRPGRQRRRPHRLRDDYEVGLRSSCRVPVEFCRISAPQGRPCTLNTTFRWRDVANSVVGSPVSGSSRCRGTQPEGLIGLAFDGCKLRLRTIARDSRAAAPTGPGDPLPLCVPKQPDTCFPNSTA